MTGKIIKGIGGFYYVHIKGHGIYECRARGLFRKDNIKPLVGDNVDIEVISDDDMTGNVISINERHNSLIRPSVANVDRALVIFATKSPEPNYNLLDRFLVMMEHQGVDTVICFNKTDLTDERYIEELKSIYSPAGYRILYTSTETDDGIDDLKSILTDSTTVVAGPSGVGKSSIINAIQSNVKMETGDISKKLNRGRHTTRHSEIIPLDFGNASYIIDTPGFSAVDINGITKDDIGSLYPEIAAYSDKCRFFGCSHISEPDCEIKRQLSLNKISVIRYDNYVRLYNELGSGNSF